MSAMKICSMLLLAASAQAANKRLLSQDSSKGLSSCKCLGTKKKYLCSTAGVKSPCIKTVDCSHAWAASGKCVNATNEQLKINAYPEDYGNSCKKHLEPGSADCYNHSVSPPVEKTAGKAAWCDDPWCYVDECACDDAKQAWSYWFKPVKITYSYATCGSADKFAATQAVKTDLSKCAGLPKSTIKKTDAADADKSKENSDTDKPKVSATNHSKVNATESKVTTTTSEASTEQSKVANKTNQTNQSAASASDAASAAVGVAVLATATAAHIFA